jgi:flagellar motor switch protein FliN/FliY
MARYEHFIFKFYEHDIFIQICAKIDESVESREQVEEDSESAEEEVTSAKAEIEDDDVSAVVPESEQPPEVVNKAPDRNVTPNNIDFILDIPIEVSVELGRTKMKVQEVSMLEEGASIVLSNTEGEPLDILANGKLIAKGEIVVENERYGIRITEVINRMERIKSLG